MDEQAAMEWHKVAKTGEVAVDEPKQVQVGENLIAIFQLGEEYFATHDVCTHEFACLTDGWTEGETVECPIHQAKFDIRTGKVLDPPATEDLRTYRVKVEGGDIYVEAPKG